MLDQDLDALRAIIADIREAAAKLSGAEDHAEARALVRQAISLLEDGLAQLEADPERP